MKIVKLNSNVMFRKSFVPMYALGLSWGGVYLVRNLPILEFESISSESQSYLVLFFLVGILGCFVGPFLSLNYSKVVSVGLVSKSTLNRTWNILLFLSMISILLTSLKMFSLLGGDFSLTNITEARLNRARDASDVKGGNIFGVLGTITSGFFIVLYMYTQWFEESLSKKQSLVTNLIFVVGILFSFLSGGRFTAAIAITAAWLIKRVSKIKSQTKSKTKEKKRQLKWYKVIPVVLGVLYAFSLMFIYRVGGTETSNIALLNYLATSLGGVELPDSHRSILLQYPFLVPLYFVCALFQYYIGHAIFQFDVLIDNFTGGDSPYLLAYQFYPFVLLLNKFGLGVISIQEILSQIPNPGVYFTLAGAFYLDFGYWGGVLAFFIICILGSSVWVGLVNGNRTFMNVYISVLFIMVILFSPIISLIGTAVFPSLIVITAILFFLEPKYKASFKRC